MPYRIIYIDEAKLDVKAAKAWYKSQRNGLQKQFSEEVIKAISRMENHPEAFAIRYRNVRIVHTNTFPYGIHFYIDYTNRHIVITAIIHNNRNRVDVQHRH